MEGQGSSREKEARQSYNQMSERQWRDTAAAAKRGRERRFAAPKREKRDTTLRAKKRATRKDKERDRRDKPSERERRDTTQ